VGPGLVVTLWPPRALPGAPWLFGRSGAAYGRLGVPHFGVSCPASGTFGALAAWAVPHFAISARLRALSALWPLGRSRISPFLPAFRRALALSGRLGALGAIDVGFRRESR
jgi:hypothetical protein